MFEVPDCLEFLDEQDEKRKCLAFKDGLIKFQKQLGNENFKVNMLVEFNIWQFNFHKVMPDRFYDFIRTSIGIGIYKYALFFC